MKIQYLKIDLNHAYFIKLRGAVDHVLIILLIKKTGEKVIEKDIEKIKNRIVRQEKEKKLQMFSKAHYSKLEKTIQISFL